MKKLIWLKALLLLGSGALAQAYDTSYRATYWEQKYSLFKLLPNTPGEVIFLGNSITDIGEWAEIWQNPKVKNRGISADNTFGVLARLHEVVESRPERIYLMIGVNDLARSIPVEVILANHRKIAERIKAASPKTKLIVQSVLPTNNHFTQFAKHQNKDSLIRQVNDGLRKMAAEMGHRFVDVYSKMLDADGRLDALYTNDGLHLNGAGYMRWKEVLEEEGVSPNSKVKIQKQ